MPCSEKTSAAERQRVLERPSHSDFLCFLRTTEAEPRRPTSLILTPTRELAEQIYKVLDPLAYDIDELYVDAMYGGVSYKKQFRALDRGVDVLVACPGRLLDLMERGASLA